MKPLQKNYFNHRIIIYDLFSVYIIIILRMIITFINASTDYAY